MTLTHHLPVRLPGHRHQVLWVTLSSRQLLANNLKNNVSDDARVGCCYSNGCGLSEWTVFARPACSSAAAAVATVAGSVGMCARVHACMCLVQVGLLHAQGAMASLHSVQTQIQKTKGSNSTECQVTCPIANSRYRRQREW